MSTLLHNALDSIRQHKPMEWPHAIPSHLTRVEFHSQWLGGDVVCHLSVDSEVLHYQCGDIGPEIELMAVFVGGVDLVEHLTDVAVEHIADEAAAYLSGAYLRGANLRGHKLVGSRPFLQIGPIGSRCAYLTLWLTDGGARIQTGCFFGTRDEFAAAVAKEHGDNDHGREYRAALMLIDSHAAIWTQHEDDWQ